MRRAISAAIRLESMPPLSITPSGTSLISCRPTASSRSSSSCASQSASGTADERRRLGVLPVPLDPHTRRLDDEPMPRQQLLDLSEDRPRSGDEAERQQQLDRLDVDLGRDEPRGEQGLQLGAEQQDVADLGEIERLDADVVAREQRPAATLVPDDEREHPVQALGRGVSRVLVERRQDLGVAGRREPVAAAFELGADGPVVVELAVLRRDHGALGFHIGWWPSATSMMLSLRTPIAMPSAR